MLLKYAWLQKPLIPPFRIKFKNDIDECICRQITLTDTSKMETPWEITFSFTYNDGHGVSNGSSEIDYIDGVYENENC